MKRVLIAIAALAAAPACYADTFGNGVNMFTIDFVTIGNPGNPADTTGRPNPAGSVPYVYQMGKYEISEQMIDKANALGNLGITKDTRGPDKPATSISWNEAAQFVNWLNTSSGFSPAYKFDASGNYQLWQPSDPGYNSANQFRNSLARYVLPSANEWYKSAYFDPVAGIYHLYPTGSDTAPMPVPSGTAAGTAVFAGQFSGQPGPADITQAGGLSPYGTMAQGGNAAEWNETEISNLPPQPGAASIRGGGFADNGGQLRSDVIFGNPIASYESDLVGFRVAAVVPEPNSAVIFATGSLAIAGLWIRPSITGRRKNVSSARGMGQAAEEQEKQQRPTTCLADKGEAVALRGTRCAARAGGPNSELVR